MRSHPPVRRSRLATDNDRPVVRDPSTSHLEHSGLNPVAHPRGGTRDAPASDSQQLIQVVIADGRPMFRDGLRRLLQTEPCLRIVGETGSGYDAASLVRDLRPDILLVDFVPL